MLGALFSVFYTNYYSNPNAFVSNFSVALFFSIIFIAIGIHFGYNSNKS